MASLKKSKGGSGGLLQLINFYLLIQCKAEQLKCWWFFFSLLKRKETFFRVHLSFSVDALQDSSVMLCSVSRFSRFIGRKHACRKYAYRKLCTSLSMHC